MDLTYEFRRFVGTIIKDPERLSTDTDPAADEIVEAARARGLPYVYFDKAGAPPPQATRDVVALHVKITKDGVPEDRPWAWRVAGFEVG